MPIPTSRKRNAGFALVLGAAMAAGACSSLRDEAVPGCPWCGDPVTRVGADGRAEVVPRWRLGSRATLVRTAQGPVGNLPPESQPAAR